MRAARALALRTFASGRVRTLSFAFLFAVYAAANTFGYGKTYPTVADRLSFAQSIGENKAVRLFYGTPFHLETIGGYASWRVGGLLGVAAGLFGLLATVRAFRSEEESGRQEIVAAGTITRGSAFMARLAAVGVSMGALWLAVFGGLVIGGLPPGGSAYLALAIVISGVVYASVGLLASQLAPSGLGALQLGGAVLGLDFVVRVIADTMDVRALHWVMPLGWVEELRAFAGPQPAVFILPAMASVMLITAALTLERRRDIGTALLRPCDTVERPRFGLLRSPDLLALRSQVTSLTVWIGAVASFGVVLGIVSRSVASVNLPDSLREQMRKLGAVDFTTPSGYIGLVFLFFVLAIALFCCGQLGTVREEESEARLETLFALPESRTRWLAGRLVLAAGSSTLIAVAAGTGAGIGTAAAGANVSFLRLIEAGLNCLPASLLFLGISALLYAASPRAAVGMAYALVSGAFIWELIGSLLGVPSWALGISPFHQIGFVPAAPFRALPAAVMLAIGVTAALAGLARFRSRDLVGA